MATSQPAGCSRGRDYTFTVSGDGGAATASDTSGRLYIQKLVAQNRNRILRIDSDAAKLGGPVLIVRPAQLPPRVEAELRRMRPTQLVVAGGRAAPHPRDGGGDRSDPRG
ncbi:MAG TPA: hypothetical protein VM324_00200 [Egibacteraceae bacterium]|nr:hypothetical protein [Egibacteraceae bacterium]